MTVSSTIVPSKTVELSEADFETGLVGFDVALVVATLSVSSWSDDIDFVFVNGVGFGLDIVDELVFE